MNSRSFTNKDDITHKVPDNIKFGKPKSGALPRVWLEINTKAIISNVQAIKRHVDPLNIMAVLKADAYGLGVESMAKVLLDAPVSCFGVAEVSKALLIKQLGKPVHILGGLIDEDVPIVVKEDFIAPITDLIIAEKLNAEAKKQGKKALVQIKVDTGMGRLGILAEQAYEAILEIKELQHLDCVGIYSHFPFAYGDDLFSLNQIEKFNSLLKKLSDVGINFNLIHISNSDGIQNIPAALRSPFNMVRTGINLYGFYDEQGKRSVDLSPVLELRARLVAVRDMPKDYTIGYGCTYKIQKSMRVGTVSIGYADGVPMGISSKGHLFVRGIECPVIGRVSMDFTTISLDKVPEAKVGDEVVCLNNQASFSDWAEYRGTVIYEVLCSFGTRVERCYV